MESVADIDLTNIGWVAAGGMSGELHQTRRMELAWAYELYQRCQQAGIPYLYKQSSNYNTERGIDGLNRYMADLERREYSIDEPLVRQYPATTPGLLPFVEHGKRYTDAQWAKARKGMLSCPTSGTVPVPSTGKLVTI